MLKLSVTAKLDGIRSWSLQALDTCPGSKASDGSLVDACKGCYATTGNYNYPNVKAPRIHNREDWQRDSWVDDMVKALDSDRYFRWFDSGDMYALGLAEKMLEVANIFARSPYIVTINQAGQVETKIELRLWNGTGSAPTDPTYTLSKLIPLPSQIATYYNIS